MNNNRMTIYVNEQDKKDIEALKALLEKQGANIRDERGMISVSKMFRYLRNEKLHAANQKTNA